MANTALNRTMVALLTNQSGGSVAQGDVVVVDSANASSFTTNTAGAYVSGSIGVVLEPNGIAAAATGTVALGGWVPKVTLSGSASLGDVFKSHTVAKQAVRHAAPVVAGDFGEVLGTGTSPAAYLWGAPNQGGGGGSSTLAGDTDVSISSPTTGDTLIWNGTAWVNLKLNKVQLAYAAATDIATAVSVPATTWTDLGTNQSFTVDEANSLVDIIVDAATLTTGAAGQVQIAARVVIDSAGTPVNKQIGGAIAAGGNWGYYPATGTIPGLSLASGSHTVKIQVFASSAVNVYCRAATSPDTEFLKITAIERK